MRKFLLVAGLAVAALASGARTAHAFPLFVGSWRVDEGPDWFDVPTAYSGRQAAALLFGGLPTDYVVSTLGSDPAAINNSAWYSVWGGEGCGGLPPCGSVFDHDYVASTLGRYEDLGDASAYVNDWAIGPQFTNYAFRVSTVVPEPSTVGLMVTGLGLLGAGTLRRRRTR